ncbi:GNAT family N-acetyltransferase [Microvirga pakistanensis]|uniref:GNAT family N-acetyltransferase n=1 Tax=Microvirga pakistanensis TaxID=1682650 RepID=UPI00106CE859|nr:GNAT family N-acetyltransferase [Microvirga pakistanensis]
MNYHLELLARPHSVVRQIILNGLSDFNRTSLMPGLHIEDMAVVIRQADTKEIFGGLWGRTGWGWLTIEFIFVPEALRGQGFATRLIGMAEEEAHERGCHFVWLDTLNPKALALYERLGYERFGELKDFPIGGSRFFLQKKLEQPAAA